MCPKDKKSFSVSIFRGSNTTEQLIKTDNSMCDEHIDEVEWRPEQFLKNNFFTFPGRISDLSPGVFGDKNGSKWPLHDNVLSSEISPLKLRKTFEKTNSSFSWK